MMKVIKKKWRNEENNLIKDKVIRGKQKAEYATKYLIIYIYADP